jgi:hypothetical protein
MSEINQKKSGRGGARPGAGRPKGSTERVTIEQILSSLEQHTGHTYAEVLAQDFEAARLIQDRGTVIKYHNLILNKVAPSLQAIEVSDSQAAVTAKAAAFQEALAKLVSSEVSTK